jgi:hypothetical protein
MVILDLSRNNKSKHDLQYIKHMMAEANDSRGAERNASACIIKLSPVPR